MFRLFVAFPFGSRCLCLVYSSALFLLALLIKILTLFAYQKKKKKLLEERRGKTEVQT